MSLLGGVANMITGTHNLSSRFRSGSLLEDPAGTDLSANRYLAGQKFNKALYLVKNKRF